MIGAWQDAIGLPLEAGPPRVFLLAEHSGQKPWLDAVVAAAGLSACGFATFRALQWQHTLLLPDLWLATHEHPLDWPEFLRHEQRLALPSHAGWSTAALDDAAAQVRQLLTGRFDPPAHPVAAAEQPEAPFKLLIGASLGGPAALAAFLQALPASLPVGIVVAQHIDAHMVRSLPRVLSRHNGWQAVLLDQQPVRLGAGQIVVLSTDGTLAFDPEGRLWRTDTPWPPPYRPCINAAALTASAQWRDRLCFVVMSGMGNDGAEAAPQVVQRGGVVWVQSSDSAQCASQPDASAATGVSSFAGDPVQLALQVATWVQERSAARPPKQTTPG